MSNFLFYNFQYKSELLRPSIHHLGFDKLEVVRYKVETRREKKQSGSPRIRR